MHTLPAYLHLSRDAWIGAGIGFVASVALLSILVWVSRRRYVIIGSSPASDTIAYQLGRIADTLDRISGQGVIGRADTYHRTEREPERETRRVRESVQESSRNENPVTVPPEEKPALNRRVSMSMFGR